jgi:prefoldin subunit 5
LSSSYDNAISNLEYENSDYSSQIGDLNSEAAQLRQRMEAIQEGISELTQRSSNFYDAHGHLSSILSQKQAAERAISSTGYHQSFGDYLNTQWYYRATDTYQGIRTAAIQALDVLSQRLQSVTSQVSGLEDAISYNNARVSWLREQDG